MHKILLLFVVALLANWSAKAQQGFPEHISHTDHLKFGIWTTEDKTAVIFADVCNIRSSPDAKAEVAGKLTIGTSVQILEISSVKFTQSGITSPWIKIKSGPLIGYVWGGLLTKGSVVMGDGLTAVWGITDIKTVDESEKVHASVRIASKGTLFAKHDFLVQYGSNPDEGNLELYPAPKLSGIKYLLVFQTLSEACGVYASSHYLLFDGIKLVFVGSGYSMGDGGMLHTSKEYLFPYPTDGNYDYHYKANDGHILCVENDAGYDDDCIWVETYKVKDFLWEESAFKKSCEY